MRVLDLSYHPLDVRSGGWVDLSRKGNHGTPYGGARPYMIAPGVMGYWFDENSGYVDCGNDESLNVTGDFITISVWVKRNVLSGIHYIVSKGRNPDSCYAYTLYQNNTRFYWYPIGGEEPVSSSHNDYNWHYVVGIYDRTLPSANAKIYVDGILEGTANNTNQIENVTCRVTVGADPLPASYFNGLVAQPIIEDRAWSEAEVRENMYRSPLYRMLRGLPHSMIYTKVPWKQTQGGIYVP